MTWYRSRTTTLHSIVGFFLFLLYPSAGGYLSLDSKHHISERPWNCHRRVLDTSPRYATNLQYGLLQVSSLYWASPARTLWAMCGFEDSVSQLDCKARCRRQALGRLQVAVWRVTGAKTGGGSWGGRSLLSGLTESCLPNPYKAWIILSDPESLGGQPSRSPPPAVQPIRVRR